MKAPSAEHAPPRRPRARSKPRLWRQRNVPRKWRYRLAPDPRKRRPKGVPGMWVRGRRLLLSWWPWGLVFLWANATQRLGWTIGAGFAALVTYLLSPIDHPTRYGLEHQFSVDSEEFLPSISGGTAVPFTHGNRLDLLNNGDEFYPAMLAAIKGAEASITIEAYIYWAGEIGLLFAQTLSDKARKGVVVKILLDAIGSATIGEPILEILESGGCQVAWYHPIHWYTLDRFNNRTHRKSLIVDGRIGFTGGAGIADHWQGHAQDVDHWRDMQIRLEGPAVVPLQSGFALNWLETTGELVSGERFYPVLPPAGRLAAQTILSSPEIGSFSVRTMYFLSMVCAERTIHIANPYFVPDTAAVETLVDAKRRGVTVRVIVSGIHNDNWLARHNSLLLYGRLLRHGIEIYEYNRTMLHNKIMVVDGVWATIGTTNFDSRSFAHNDETNVCFYEPALVQKMEQSFMADLAVSEKISLEQWERRGILTKAQDIISALLQDQV